MTPKESILGTSSAPERGRRIRMKRAPDHLPTGACHQARPCVRGKFLYVGGEKFYVRGVTYGTFRPDASGDEFPAPEIVSPELRIPSEPGPLLFMVRSVSRVMFSVATSMRTQGDALGNRGYGAAPFTSLSDADLRTSIARAQQALNRISPLQ